MSKSSEMRTRVETAIRTNQLQQRQKAANETTVAKHQITSNRPTIKLKTDFRNFSA